MTALHTISLLKEVSDQDPVAINQLLTELSAKHNPQTSDELQKTIAKSAVFVARGSEGRIIGVLVLVPVHKLTTTPVGMIHDVVVEERLRGQGIGRALMDAAVSEARRMGLRYLEFTSSPARAEANRLYQKMGFKPRETNVYRIEL